MPEEPGKLSLKFGVGSKVRFKTLEPSPEDPNQARLRTGTFMGVMADPKFAPIPMYVFMMEPDKGDNYIKLVSVHALLWLDILDYEEATSGDVDKLKEKLEGDKSIYV